MLVIRTLSWKDLTTFQDLAKTFCKFVRNKAGSQNTMRIDFIFDSYFEKSIKSSERLRRRKSECIIYNNINESIPLPKETDKFWGSPENKILIQTFLRSYIEKNEDFFLSQELIFSTINEIPAKSVNPEKSECYLRLLQCSDVEEADVKIMVHSQHAVKQGFKNIYIISSDTGVIVLALYFWMTFKENGLEVRACYNILRLRYTVFNTCLLMYFYRVSGFELEHQIVYEIFRYMN